MIEANKLEQLRTAFGSALQENVKLSNFTTMNVGGPADALVIAHSAERLAEIVVFGWELDLEVHLLGVHPGRRGLGPCASRASHGKPPVWF